MDMKTELVEVIQLTSAGDLVNSEPAESQTLNMDFLHHNTELLSSLNSCEDMQSGNDDQPHLQLVTSELKETPTDNALAPQAAPISCAAPILEKFDVTRIVLPEENQDLKVVTRSSKSAAKQPGNDVHCCNCNSSIDIGRQGPRPSKGFAKVVQESVTCQLFHVASKELKVGSVKILDALRNLYRIDLSSSGDKQYSALKNQSDLAMCAACISVLSKLYELFNEFIYIFMRNESILAKIVNVEKLLEKEAGTQARNLSQGTTCKRECNLNDISKRKVTEIVHNERGQAVLKCEKDAVTSKSVQKKRNIQKHMKRRKRGRIQLKNKNKDAFSQKRISESGSENNLLQPISTKLSNGRSDSPKELLDKLAQGFLSDDDDVPCDRCGKRFKTFGGLKIHYAAHLRDDNKVTCKECGKQFKKPEALEMHEKVDHKGFKPHKCTHEGCDRSFRLKDKLKLHIKVMHEKNLPFPCPKCEKAFRTKYHLKVHDVAQHVQGDDTIGCTKCRRKFPSRDALETHVKTHEEEKLFVCRQCNKGFKTSSRLKLHVKCHDALPSAVCATCGKAYKHIRDLRLHEVTHQDESSFRFACSDCPRRFYRIDLLRVHQSNEKHFSQEVVGPSISQLARSTTVMLRMKHHKESERLSETNAAIGTTSCTGTSTNSPKGKPKQGQKIKTDPIIKMKIRDSLYDCLGSPALFPSMAPTDAINDSTNNLEIVELSPSLINATITNSLNRKNVQDTPDQSSYILNEKDPIITNVVSVGSNSLTIPEAQSSNNYSLPGSLTANTIYTVKDSSERNISSFSIAAGAEQIGYDVINAFINNLN